MTVCRTFALTDWTEVRISEAVFAQDREDRFRDQWRRLMAARSHHPHGECVKDAKP